MGETNGNRPLPEDTSETENKEGPKVRREGGEEQIRQFLTPIWSGRMKETVRFESMNLKLESGIRE